jgi:hypothetical protein
LLPVEGMARRGELEGSFAAACRGLGIRHTRTLPGHAWTDGRVERLQGTIVPQHWRDVLPTKAAPLGHRLRGRTPAELFTGVAPVAR